MVKAVPRKILNTAERLFVRQGVGATSLRAINTAAGTSQGLLHYHFGSKDKLLEALLEQRMQPLMQERLTMLAALDAAEPPASIRQLLEVIARPLARLAIDSGPAGRRTVRLLARLYAENNPVHQRVADRYFKRSGEVMLMQLKCSLPNLSQTQLELRLEVASSAIFSTLANLHKPHRSWQPNLSKAPDSYWLIVDDLLRFLTKGFDA